MNARRYHAVLLCCVITGCASPTWEATYQVASADDGVVGLACEGTRAALIRPDGFSIVAAGAKGLETQATVTGVKTPLGMGQGSARLLADRLVVAAGQTLEIFDVSAAPTLVQGSVPLEFRAPFELVGHHLYVGSGGGLAIYDLTDAKQPRLLDSSNAVDGRFLLPLSMRVQGTVLYVVGGNHAVLTAYSVADPTTPTLLSELSLKDFGVNETAGFEFGHMLPVGKHLVMNLTLRGKTSQHLPLTVNISDPAKMVVTQGLELASTACTVMPLASEGAQGVIGIIGGNRSVVFSRSNFQDEVGMIDLSTPADPRYVCSRPELEGVSFRSATDICFAGDTLLHVYADQGGEGASRLFRSKRK